VVLSVSPVLEPLDPLESAVALVLELVSAAEAVSVVSAPEVDVPTGGSVSVPVDVVCASEVVGVTVASSAHAEPPSTASSSATCVHRRSGGVSITRSSL
jgi:hypothetical protein